MTAATRKTFAQLGADPRYHDPFIIEHVGFGVYCGFKESPTTLKQVPHFKAQAKRVDPAVQRFATYGLALGELTKVRAHSRYRRAYVHKLGGRQNVYQHSLSPEAKRRS